jgi:AcrR family transcriptional regulator
MSTIKTGPASTAPTTRARVLAAAERLLGTGRPDFSMRDLAAEAGVSFATPFNQFGNKGAILQALSAERIASMQSRFSALERSGDAPSRVFAAVGIATAVMLEKPAVNRAVMGGLGAPGDQAGRVWAQSRALWAGALGDGEGLAPAKVSLALDALPGQLALSFRGVLSFWSAGEIADDELAARAASAAAALLLGFVPNSAREPLERRLATAATR